MTFERHDAGIGASGRPRGWLILFLAIAGVFAAAAQTPAVAHTVSWPTRPVSWIAIPEFPPASDICLGYFDQAYGYACLKRDGQRLCGCWLGGPRGRWRASV